ncbi:uncharacterized protein PgNI_12486 [Pyricularia grisea]|uniref:non-specific serine/threonine protein kinase n=1 Tax=Pyricularia grisea TaxID=148305 RepID=A0A6P8AMK6_PYRGI|nr:uncharacterized protein PgNI_12486 [Pyricularia grisea]TLD03249.1 hypothetical protein PgNI_12486 [Pyricularia grisea]
MRDQPPMNDSSDTAAESALLPDLPLSPSRDGKDDAAPSTPISSVHLELDQQAPVSDDQPASEDEYRQNGPIRSPPSPSEQSATSMQSQPQIDWRDVPVVYPFRRTEEGAWMPPYEPDRPENPYCKGFKTTIYLHEPPLDNFYVDEEDRIGPTPGIEDNRDLRLKTLVDACLSSRICKGKTFQDRSHQLEVVDEIAVRDTHGAQIVVCKLDGEPKTYVAKIYDPLYYSFVDQDLPYMPRSTTIQADQDYCNEANVYAGLRYTALAGNEIPAYQGSFTFDMPLDLPESRGRHMRPVRLIIMEHIEGAKTMEDMDPSSLPASLRLDILAQLFAANIALMNCGVLHSDLCERNILIRLPKTTQEDCGEGKDDDIPLRVVLFDFNVSSYEWKPEKGTDINDEGEYEDNIFLRPEFWPKKLPRHPARIYWNKMEYAYGSWDEWWPDSWRRSKTIAEWNAWLLEQWTDTRFWKPVWDCLMRAQGPLDPSKEGFFVPEEDEQSESEREEDEHDQEEYDQEEYDQEEYGQEKYDKEEDEQDEYEKEKYDRESDEQKKHDQDTYNKEPDEREASEADKDEPEQDRASFEAQADVDSDAKNTETKEQQQMSAPVLESSTASPENGPDAIKDDSTTIPPEAIVKDSVDQHSVSTREEVVSQDGPSPSASAETTEHDGRELMDDNNNGPR